MATPADPELVARILAKTNEYLDTPAVVGCEAPLLDHLARDFAALGAEVERPANLCVARLGEGPAFLAHVDRPGAILDGDGVAVFTPAPDSSDNAPHAASDPIAGLIKRYAGEEVYAYDPRSGGRLAYGDVGEARVDADGRLVLDVKDLPPLPAGTPIAFSRALDRTQSGYISGELDNPISAAVLRVVAEFGLRGTLIFTAEEEAGRSAGHMLDWAAQAGFGPSRELVVLDTTPFDDGAAALAGAVILRRRDATASFEPDMVSRVEKAASSVSAPIIFKDSFIERENDARARRGGAPKSMGVTELGRNAAASQGRYTGATLQLPTFAYQSSAVSTTPRALGALARTVLAI